MIFYSEQSKIQTNGWHCKNVGENILSKTDLLASLLRDQFNHLPLLFM